MTVEITIRANDGKVLLQHTGDALTGLDWAAYVHCPAEHGVELRGYAYEPRVHCPPRTSVTRSRTEPPADRVSPK